MVATVKLYTDNGGAFRLDGWADRAACKGLANAAILEDPDRETEAKSLCLGDQATGRPRCPVIDDCHRWVIPLPPNKDPGGVRAGRNEAERNDFRRGRTTGHRVKSSSKHCPRCEETKARGEFYRNRNHSDGLDTYCKPCSAEIRAEQRARKAAA
jgi:hypothetical protein